MKHFCATLLLYIITTLTQIQTFLCAALILGIGGSIVLLRRVLGLESGEHELTTPEYFYHDNELNHELINHLPHYFLSGVSKNLPAYLHAHTTFPWIWRATLGQHKIRGQTIVTSFDGCAVDLEIFWSKSKRCKGDSPAIIIVPDLASASSGEHYVRVLLDTLARRDLGNVCVVNTYRMTILPDDTTYLRACIGAFGALLEEKRKEWLREEEALESTTKASQFMFDHTSGKDGKDGKDDDDKKESTDSHSKPPSKNEEEDSTSSELKPHPIAAISYATGGILMTKYLSRFRGTEIITSAVNISSSYDLNSLNSQITKSWWFFHPFYLWSNKQKSLSDHRCRIANGDISIPPSTIAYTAMTTSLDRLTESHLLNRLTPDSPSYYLNAKSYNEKISLNKDLQDVGVPLLNIHALDDPLLSFSTVPLLSVDLNPYLMFCVTPTGGHCGWLTSWNRSFAADCSISFLMRFERFKDDKVMGKHYENVKRSMEDRVFKGKKKKKGENVGKRILSVGQRKKDVLSGGGRKSRKRTTFEQIVMNSRRPMKMVGSPSRRNRVKNGEEGKVREEDEVLRRLNDGGGHLLDDTESESEEEDEEEGGGEAGGMGASGTPVAPVYVGFFQQSEKVTLLVILLGAYFYKFR
ncbi:hypothetical protein TL16_g05571 [Triparma laevis f. inornata]|uniref:Uncharacterized protein n=1 Tax=Triparma laevis f. inornata TaxID=1714386 RepID=A0A9W7ECE8_9STRA|nr:hypothetical protein TL16_g05571 [Triparma laevis f. inornata]